MKLVFSPDKERSRTSPVSDYRGTSPIREHPPPQEPPRTLGLRWGPWGEYFLVNEVPLQGSNLFPVEEHGRQAPALVLLPCFRAWF